MTQFVIWGFGKFGKWILSMLGEKRVIAIIDQDQSMWESKINEICIISYDTYQKDYKYYPIIISPRDYEDEIEIQLLNDSINYGFKFSENLLSMECFLRQIDTVKLLEKCASKKIILYGFSVLTILLHDWLKDNNIKCRVGLSERELKIYGAYVKRLLEVNPQDISKLIDEDSTAIILTAENEGIINLSKDRLLNFSKIGLQKGVFKNKKIEKFKNKHIGERCFVVATGPSLTIHDLNILKEYNEICISVNGIINAFTHTRWRPDYYAISDPTGLNLWKSDILKMDVKEMFVADIAWNFQENEIKDNMYKWHLIREWDVIEGPKFSDDFSEGAYEGHTIIYEAGLQLAAYMGFSEIYLLGADCTAGKVTVHFYSGGNNSPSEKSHLDIESIFLSYKAAKKYADSHGIKIYNATRGGNLEVFPRVDFDSLFQSEK